MSEVSIVLGGNASSAAASTPLSEQRTAQVRTTNESSQSVRNTPAATVVLSSSARAASSGESRSVDAAFEKQEAEYEEEKLAEKDSERSTTSISVKA